MLVYESLLSAWPRAEPLDSSGRGRQAATDRVKKAGAQGAPADWVDAAGGPGQGAELWRRRSGRGQHYAAAAAASTTPQRRLLLLECLLGHPQAARLLRTTEAPPDLQAVVWLSSNSLYLLVYTMPLASTQTRYLLIYLFILDSMPSLGPRTRACRACCTLTG